MSLGIEVLNQNELEAVKGVLIGLITSLEQRRAVGSQQHGLMSDEAIVLEALKHPERGDVEVIIVRQPGLANEIFLSNRREADSPFSVMNEQMALKHTERRALDKSGVLGKGQVGLFLLGFQDREMLKEQQAMQVRVFSSHLGISKSPEKTADAEVDAKYKTLADCTPEEKWIIFKQNKLGDNRVEKIKNEFFLIQVHFAIYKQPAKMVDVLLLPDNFENKIGQLIRDAYPYGIRVSLRSNYPKEHKEQLAKVHLHIKELVDKLEAKDSSNFPPEVKEHWLNVQTYVRDILVNDAELGRFV